MSNAGIVDLWGTIPLEGLDHPLSIIRAQADLLSKKTNGLVEARLVDADLTLTVKSSLFDNDSDLEIVCWHFEIHAPNRSYHHRLFTFGIKPQAPYPCYVVDGGQVNQARILARVPDSSGFHDSRVACVLRSQIALEAALSVMLQAESTAKAIQNLAILAKNTELP